MLTERPREILLVAKLLGVIAIVVTLGTAIVWLSINYFAFDYFSELLTKYEVPKKNEVLQMFLDAAHRGLFASAVLSLSLGLSTGLLLIRLILRPLYQMIVVTRKISKGDYRMRVSAASSDELGELGKAFNAMTDNLQRVENLRRQMVIDVGHELRAPLTNIRGYLEALTSGLMQPTPEVIGSLHEETLRLGNLIDDLMRLSAADAARLTLSKKTFDLAELITRTLTLFHARFEEKAITADPAFESRVWEVHADDEKLAQVVQNIVDNAWRYTPSGGRVRIHIEKTSGGTTVVCANSGDPIAKEDLTLIFERFYRTKRSRSREDRGFGIGLAIAKEMVEAHGGSIGAESVAGENRIWFSLPD